MSQKPSINNNWYALVFIEAGIDEKKLYKKEFEITETCAKTMVDNKEEQQKFVQGIIAQFPSGTIGCCHVVLSNKQSSLTTLYENMTKNKKDKNKKDKNKKDNISFSVV